jgi:hypothetical protein
MLHSPEQETQSKIATFWQTMENLWCERDLSISNAQKAFALLQEILGLTEELELEFGDGLALYHNEALGKSSSENIRLSQHLCACQIRTVVFKREVSTEELLDLIKIFRVNLKAQSFTNDDLFSLLCEKSFERIEFIPVSIEEELSRAKGPWEKFSTAALNKACAPLSELKYPSNERDLKTLQEFKINPNLFLKSDEEVDRVIRSIQKKEEFSEAKAQGQLLEFALKILLTTDEPKQLSLIREATSKTLIHLMGAGCIEQVEETLEKLKEIQKLHSEKSTAVSEILDAVFSQDHVHLMTKSLSEPESRRRLIRILTSLGPQAILMCARLVSSAPELSAHISETLKLHTDVLAKVSNAVSKEPDGTIWPVLIQILAEAKNPYVIKIVKAWLQAAKPELRINILAHISSFQTPEIVQVLIDSLKSESSKERYAAYELLGSFRSQKVFNALLSKLKEENLGESNLEEFELCLASMVRIAGDASLSLLEQLWENHSKKLFGKKSETPRRLALLRAVTKGQPSLLSKLQSKIPLEKLPSEEREFFMKCLSQTSN